MLKFQICPKPIALIVELTFYTNNSSKSATFVCYFNYHTEANANLQLETLAGLLFNRLELKVRITKRHLKNF